MGSPFIKLMSLCRAFEAKGAYLSDDQEMVRRFEAQARAIACELTAFPELVEAVKAVEFSLADMGYVPDSYCRSKCLEAIAKAGHVPTPATT